MPGDQVTIPKILPVEDVRRFVFGKDKLPVPDELFEVPFIHLPAPGDHPHLPFGREAAVDDYHLVIQVVGIDLVGKEVLVGQGNLVAQIPARVHVRDPVGFQGLPAALDHPTSRGIAPLLQPLGEPHIVISPDKNHPARGRCTEPHQLFDQPAYRAAQIRFVVVVIPNKYQDIAGWVIRGQVEQLLHPAPVAVDIANDDVAGGSVQGTGTTTHSLVSTCMMERKASWGISTRPTCFMRFLPSFCRSRSLRLRVMSPP